MVVESDVLLHLLTALVFFQTDTDFIGDDVIVEDVRVEDHLCH